MSLTGIISLESATREFFMNSTSSCLESGNQTFLGSGGRNESNSQQLARIGEKKICDEHDVHHVQEVGIKRFWAQDTEMSLTAITSLESAREKFLMKSTYIMSRNQESNAVGSGGRNESKSQQLARIGEKKVFHEVDVHHVQKVGIKRFCTQEAEMSLTAIISFESAIRKFFMNSTYIMSRKQESNVFGLRTPK